MWDRQICSRQKCKLSKPSGVAYIYRRGQLEESLYNEHVLRYGYLLLLCSLSIAHEARELKKYISPLKACKERIPQAQCQKINKLAKESPQFTYSLLSGKRKRLDSNGYYNSTTLATQILVISLYARELFRVDYCAVRQVIIVPFGTTVKLQ